MKIKESEMRDKYLHLTRELRKLWNMRVTVIPIGIGVSGIVSKGLDGKLKKLKIRGQIKTIQTVALLRMSRILRVLET